MGASGLTTTNLQDVRSSRLTTEDQTFMLLFTGLRSLLPRMLLGLHLPRLWQTMKPQLSRNWKNVRDLPVTLVDTKVDPAKAEVAMRPSKIFNDLMDKY